MKLNDTMYANIGKKIKMLAKVICWIGIILSCIIGLVNYFLSFPSEEAKIIIRELFIGLAIAAGGSLISWISSFVLYGFGELIDKTSSLERHFCSGEYGCEDDEYDEYEYVTKSVDTEKGKIFYGAYKDLDAMKVPKRNGEENPKDELHKL